MDAFLPYTLMDMFSCLIFLQFIIINLGSIVTDIVFLAVFTPQPYHGEYSICVFFYRVLKIHTIKRSSEYSLKLVKYYVASSIYLGEREGRGSPWFRR